MADGGASSHSGSDASEDVLHVIGEGGMAESLLKRERQIEWMTELFKGSIGDIVAQQKARKKGPTIGIKPPIPNAGGIPLDEVVPVLPLSKYRGTFDAKAAVRKERVAIPEDIIALVRDYVSIVRAAANASLFRLLGRSI